MADVVGEIAACFFQNITRIERHPDGEVENERHFLWFLKSLNSLDELALISPKVESFYQLPASVCHSNCRFPDQSEIRKR